MPKHKWIREEQPAKLPTWELGTYSAIWLTILAYAYYNISRFTSENQDLFSRRRLVDGWWFIGGSKDENDFENWFWKAWIKEAWPVFLGHIVLGQICRAFSFKTRQRLMVLYDLGAIAWLLTPYAVAFWAVTILTVAIVAYSARSMKAVWLLLCVLIYLLQWEWKYPNSTYAIFLKWICHNDFNKKMLLRYSTFFGYLKMASFGHDIIYSLQSNDQTATKDSTPPKNATDNKDDGNTSKKVRQRERDITSLTNGQNKGNSEGNDNTATNRARSSENPESGISVLNVVQYMFYLPVFFTGPLFTFKDFNKQITAPILPWSKDRIRVLVLDTMRVLAWGFVWELMLHYIYPYSIQYNEFILEKLTFWELAGEICVIVPFFYVKYVVIYGLPGNIARCDQITPPYTPACVHSTYKYAEDWRLFDRGLYSVLIRHIYIPLGGSRHGPARQLLASVTCFSFTCFWHGAMDYVLAWSAFNLFIVGAEAAANYVVDTPTSLKLEKKYLSGAMVRRLSCVFWVPMRLLHTTATLIFIGGIMPIRIFLRRMFFDGFPTVTICVFLAYYFFVQLCMETHRRRYLRLNSTKEKKE